MQQVSRRLVGRRQVLVVLGSSSVAAAVFGLAPVPALARDAERRRERARIELPEGDRFELLGEALCAGTRLGEHGVLEAVLAAIRAARAAWPRRVTSRCSSPIELLSFRERHRAHPEGVFSLWS